MKPESVVSLPVSASVADAAGKMAQNKVGSVILMDNHSIAGMFTERDLLNRVIATGLDPKATPVTRVMSKTVSTISVHETVQNCFNLMQKTKCRHLPIVEGGKVVGMVSMRNILEWIISEMETENIQLKKYIQS